MGLIQRLARSPHIHDDVAERFARHLAGPARILDAPVGEGDNARTLAAAGHAVVGGDIRPEHCGVEGIELERVNLEEPLPFADASFDGILHSEGIEHLDAQLAVLREFARVLKPGGVLIVTTPNLLHLEARLNRMLTAHPHRRRAIVVETAADWEVGDRPEDADETYFGHVFLIDAFQLRFYLQHVGLDVVEVDTARYSVTSVLLAPLLWPWVRFATGRILRNRRSKIPPALRRTLLSQVMSPAVLFGRKLVMTARKPGVEVSS